MKPETVTLLIQLLELLAMLGGMLVVARKLAGHAERREVVNQPLRVREDPNPVTREEWQKSIEELSARVTEVCERVDTMNATFRNDLRHDIERVHERIDGMPDRIVAILRNTGVIREDKK